MKRIAVSVAVLFFAVLVGKAEVKPVEISLPETSAWVGERVRLVLTIRAPGTFSGSASFDLPELPGTLLMKTGNAVVGSEQIDGKDWFVQTHQFSLFSQRTGVLEVPSFLVRFEAREGFTGPISEKAVETEAFQVEILRPPGSEGIPFLVTTESLTIVESWEPSLEGTKVGDVLRRTITQKATGLTGMALLPTPTIGPEGVKVYEPRIETKDNTERGAFDGERREILTYLLQREGTIEIPEVVYSWWDPKSETLRSKSLPAVTLQVAPATLSGEVENGDSPFPVLKLVLWLVGTSLACAVYWARKRVVSLLRYLHHLIDPLNRAAARRLRRGCRQNDATAARKAWSEWADAVGRDVEMTTRLKAAIVDLQRVEFGPVTSNDWCGKELLAAFEESTTAKSKRRSNRRAAALPPLNFPCPTFDRASGVSRGAITTPS